MSMPVHVRRADVPIPEKGTGYIVCQEGLRLRIDNDWLSAVIPVSEFKSLESEPKRATLLLEPINALLFAQIVAFYEAIYQLHHTEVAVLLHYNFEKKEWLVTVPTQRVSSSGVEYYDMKERVLGYRCVGTSHSHASFSAGHSQTDIMDEQCFDGVHITIGNLSAYPKFSIAPEIVVRGVRFPLPTNMIEGLIDPDASTLPVSTWRMGFDRYYGIDKTILGDWKVPQEWIDKVGLSVKVYEFRDLFGKPIPVGTVTKSPGAFVKPQSPDLPQIAEITDGFPTYQHQADRTNEPGVETSPLSSDELVACSRGAKIPVTLSKCGLPPDPPLEVPLYHPLDDLWKSIMHFIFGNKAKAKPVSKQSEVAVKPEIEKPKIEEPNAEKPEDKKE